VYLEKCNDALSIWATAGYPNTLTQQHCSLSHAREACRILHVSQLTQNQTIAIELPR
jgi:hypothetical protein